MENAFKRKFRFYCRRSRYKQKELLPKLNVDASTLSKWVNGVNRWPIDALEIVCELLDLSENERQELLELTGLDKPSAPEFQYEQLYAYRTTTGFTSEPKAEKSEERNKRLRDLSKQGYSHTIDSAETAPKMDWGTAPVTTRFFGRTDTLNTLSHWIIPDRCRLVGLVGMGGIGKTWLAAALIKQVLHDFTRFIWRSLRDAPPLGEILNDYIHFLSDKQTHELPTSPAQQIVILIKLLHERRSLLVLDNFESVLMQGVGAGRFREGYEGYGELLRAVATTDHQSCLILTSREMPLQLVLLGLSLSPVRSWSLEELDAQSARALLKEVSLSASSEELDLLASHYSGNPLALQLVAGTIRSLFSSKVADFLKLGVAFLGDVRNLLDEQFQRFSQEEQDILYWLAICRDHVMYDSLMTYMMPSLPKHRVVETLQGLQRRFWVETSSGFGLQNVILEYLTERLVSTVSDEIIRHSSECFNRHALVLAQSKYYIRDVQVRLFLQPVAQQLIDTLGREGTVARLLDLKMSLQQRQTTDTGYAGANIIHLLGYIHMGDLRGQDFSKLLVRQAILHDVDLRDVDFSHTNFSHCEFTETFGLVVDLTFSPDGQWLAIGTSSGMIHMWRITKHILDESETDFMYSLDKLLRFGREAAKDNLKINREKGKLTNSIAFHPNGEILASGHENGSIQLWETKSGRHLKTLDGHKAYLRSLAFDALGDVLASGSDDKTIRLWDTHTWQVMDVLVGHTDSVREVRFSPTASLLASSSLDGSINLWEMHTRQCLNNFRNEQDFEILSVAFSPDGSLLASGGSHGTICLWEVQTGKCYKNFLGHQNEVISVRFSPNGQLLASISYDKSVRLWDVNTGECVKVLNGHKNPVRAAAFHPTGQLLASGGDDGTVRLWNVTTGESLIVQQSYSNRIWAIATSSQSNLLASGGDDRRVLLWDLQSGKCHYNFIGHTNFVKTVTFSPDGHILASGADDLTVRLWRVSTGECIHVLHGHSDRVRSVAFHPGGGVLASGSIDRTVRLWDVDTGYCFRVYECDDAVYSVIFSLDGTLLITGTADDKVQLWDARTEKHLAMLKRQHRKPVRRLAVSQNGHILASVDDKKVYLWNIHSTHCISSFDMCWSVAFHPNDDMLFMLDYERLRPQLVDIHTGQIVRTYLGAVDSIISLTISGDGQLLIGAGDDGLIRLWNIESGECVNTLEPEKPYERMNITNVRGLTESQKTTLKMLGAMDHRK